MKMSVLGLLFVFGIYRQAVAEETDFFNDRPTQDQSQFLDLKMNKALQAVADASKTCNPETLHRSLLKKLGGWGWAEIETWVSEVESPTRITWKHQSIYKSFPGSVWGCCSENINYRGVIFSGDKLGHFLHSGYEMWSFAKATTLADKSDQRGWFAKFFDRFASRTSSSFVKLQEKIVHHQKFSPAPLTELQWAVELSVAQEEGWWGLVGTGVKSYGDMVSNIEGFHFWSNLTDGAEPYFKCHSGRWQKAKVFSWAKYVGDGWDEGINCNLYQNPMNNRHLEMRQLCPLKSCQAIKARYKNLPELISPVCKF